MLVDRMIRAAKLEPALYNEVERETEATTQALTVVIIVAIATGISGFITFMMLGDAGLAIRGFIGGIIGSVVGWVVWSFITYFVGTSVFGGTATPGEVLRCVGFAQAPGVLGIVGFIPCVGWLVALAAGIWVIVAVVVALREALDITTGKAIGTAIIGFIAVLLIQMLLGLLGLGAGMVALPG